MTDIETKLRELHAPHCGCDEDSRPYCRLWATLRTAVELGAAVERSAAVAFLRRGNAEWMIDGGWAAAFGADLLLGRHVPASARKPNCRHGIAEGDYCDPCERGS